MEKNDFLNYKALVLEVEQLQSYLDGLEASMYAPTSQRLSASPRGGSSRASTMADVAARHLDLLDLYREKLDAKWAQIWAVEQAIDSLEDPVERLVMRLRYLEGRGWAYICAKLQAKGYSERQVYRLHGFALLKLKDAEDDGR